MVYKEYSDSHATQNVTDHAINEHKNDLVKDVTEGAAPSEGGSAQAPYSDDSKVVLELKRYRAQLRDHERALVDRIADVDDERRATQSRLERTWKTQREDIDLRLRRHARLIAGLLMLFAAALFLVYRHATIGQLDIAAEVLDLREELELAQSSGEGAVDAQAREKLKWLRAEVQEIASSLGRPAEDGEQTTQASPGAERADRGQTESILGKEIHNLGAAQRRLAEGLESLRLVVQTLETVRPGAPAKTEDDSTDESDISKAGVPIPTANRTPADPVADAGAASALETEDETALADQELDTSRSGSEETVVVAEVYYALQLIGFFDRKSLERFVVRDGLPPQVYSIRRTYKDRPWHEVIHSLHENYAAAAAELARLPSDLAALNPWIRPLSAGVKLQIIKTGPEEQQ